MKYHLAAEILENLGRIGEGNVKEGTESKECSQEGIKFKEKNGTLTWKKVLSRLIVASPSISAARSSSDRLAYVASLMP